MELEMVIKLVREARKADRYVMIRYNGTYRNVYPISIRRGPGGARLHAWCEIHPTEASESFLLSKIEYGVVSEDVAVVKSAYVEDI